MVAMAPWSPMNPSRRCEFRTDGRRRKQDDRPGDAVARRPRASRPGNTALTPFIDAAKPPATCPRRLGHVVRWVASSLLGAVALILVINLGLSLALFGPGDGAARLASDWRRIWLAHAVAVGDVTPQQAFRTIYGEHLGEAPRAQDVRSFLSQELERRNPIVWDVILARYLMDRYGAIDGRSVPPGVYVAAGPIGPDAWPGPLLTHYLFPRHGYVLVVPEANGETPRPALEATASLRHDFRPGGDGDDLFAVVQAYRPGAFDFPTAGEPVHDLFLVSADPEDIIDVERRLRAAARRLDRAELGYSLFSRNSNSALRCFLRVSGLPAAKVESLRRWPLARLRLPGIGQSLWKADQQPGIPACSA